MLPSFALVLGILLICGSVECQPLVSIPLGQIQGSFMSSASGREFMAFRGIPYAKPPVGELRFKEPVAAEPFDGILDARREGPMCIQFDSMIRTLRGTEDCLVVNVYTHSQTPKNGPLPVMVWIHGGAFYLGSGNGQTDIYGPGYLMDRDIILVTLNYRLGPLGFLSTEDGIAPGNYGLLDQTLALKWVRDNIKYFGGDPNSVTIFGESAGGASVHYHIMSPHSKGLFHRAIAQSGTSTCPWSNLKTVRKYTDMLANHLNCPTSSSSELIDCLRKKRVEDVVSYRKTVAIIDLFPIAFGPRIDVERANPFLPAHPRELIEKGKYNDVPLIIGLTQNEGALTVSGMLTHRGRGMNDFTKEPLKSLTYILGVEFEKNGEQIAKRAFEKYLDGTKPFEDQLPQLEKMFSDFTMFKCINDITDLHRRHGTEPTFYYMYAHQGQYTLPTVLGVPAEINLGVCHADEIFLMFTNMVFPKIKNGEDKQVSKMLLDLWTSFAADGKPTSDLSPSWLPSTRSKQRYLKIDLKPQLLNQSMPFVDRLPFWDQIFKTSHNDELLQDRNNKQPERTVLKQTVI